MNRHHQVGASLIEVLVALLLLSLGMLSLAATLSFAVQMPKLSGYRATATNLASAYIERMRANSGADGFGGFNSGAYDKPSSYGVTTLSATTCSYPDCVAATLATMDLTTMQVAVRAELPAGGLFMERDNNSGVSSSTTGNLWIMWQEPVTYGTIVDSSSSDNCPSGVAVTDPMPRCLYVRFSI
ncbi:MAG: type IV pilus modification protein PilV [Glaciimonas sp.]|nr:type IV pilus modification protein PilV [Glaciimonas sp.]